MKQLNEFKNVRIEKYGKDSCYIYYDQGYNNDPNNNFDYDEFMEAVTDWESENAEWTFIEDERVGLTEHRLIFRKMQVNFKAVHKTVEITGYVDFSSDNPEWFYFHPLTNQECQDIDQIFQGWSEQDDELNQQWEKLAEFIRNDEILTEWVEQADFGETVVAIYDETGKANYKYE